MSEGYPRVSPLAAALFCRCPRCGQGKVLQGWLAVAPRCNRCGLDLRGEDVGDGPAALVILVLGAIVVAGAVLLEVKAEPPIWVHLLVWIPVTLAGTVFLLRALKAWLIAQQYRHHLLEQDRTK
jgi:uncharacterized protein (DUF983 family)